MKSKVNNLKRRAKELGYEIKHGHALEIFAAMQGHKDYNSYTASISTNDETLLFQTYHKLGYKVEKTNNKKVPIIVKMSIDNNTYHVAIMNNLRAGITSHDIVNLNEFMASNNCKKGVICAKEKFPHSISSLALDHNIEVLDFESFMDLNVKSLTKGFYSPKFCFFYLDNGIPMLKYPLKNDLDIFDKKINIDTIEKEMYFLRPKNIFVWKKEFSHFSKLKLPLITIEDYLKKNYSFSDSQTNKEFLYKEFKLFSTNPDPDLDLIKAIL